MDTGTHIVANLLVQSKRSQPRLFIAAAFGAILPDLPIIVFYAWESLVAGYPEHVIWGKRYFLAGWQNFIDTFNSVPIILLALLVAVPIRNKLLITILIGMLLHVMLDLPFHHDDAHRHFFPLSDWQFVSPISYWDPRHYGDIMAVVQLLIVAAGLIWLWIRHAGRFERLMIAMMGVSYIGFLVFVQMVWASSAR